MVLYRYNNGIYRLQSGEPFCCCPGPIGPQVCLGCEQMRPLLVSTFSASGDERLGLEWLANQIYGSVVLQPFATCVWRGGRSRVYPRDEFPQELLDATNQHFGAPTFVTGLDVAWFAQLAVGVNAPGDGWMYFAFRYSVSLLINESFLGYGCRDLYGTPLGNPSPQPQCAEVNRYYGAVPENETAICGTIDIDFPPENVALGCRTTGVAFEDTVSITDPEWQQSMSCETFHRIVGETSPFITSNFHPSFVGWAESAFVGGYSNASVDVSVI